MKNHRVMPPGQADASADDVAVEGGTSSFPRLVFTLVLTVGRRTGMINWVGEPICLQKKAFFPPSWISLIEINATAERNSYRPVA